MRLTTALLSLALGLSGCSKDSTWEVSQKNFPSICACTTAQEETDQFNVPQKHPTSTYYKITEQNLQQIILEQAQENQTVHFGEVHANPKDNEFVISLLPKLRKLGFDYFAIEQDSNEQELIDDYLDGKIDDTALNNAFDDIIIYIKKNGKEEYNLRETQPIIVAAHKQGYKIVLFDERTEGYTAPGDPVHSEKGCELRERMGFDNLKKKIFNENPKAKVVLFSGRAHIDEEPRFDFFCKIPNQKPLGYFLDKYTKGKNLSVSLCENFYEKIFPPEMRGKVDIKLSI